MAHDQAVSSCDLRRHARGRQGHIVTIRSAPVRPHQSLLPWGLTACAVVAGPPLLGVAQASPALALASVALGLTALVIGFAIRQRKPHVRVVAPAHRRIRALGWSPP
jgi:hypothetical protein